MQHHAVLLLALVGLVAGANARKVLQDVSSTPNFILFALDDRLLNETFSLSYEQVIKGSGVRNPNGCRPPMTWFINCCSQGRVTSTCEWVLAAHDVGHEISTHTASHSQYTLSYSYEDWVEDINLQRNWTTECGIDENLVTGFRAPYFQVNDLLGTVLNDLGWVEYDSSLKGEQPAGVGTPLQSGPLDPNNSLGLTPYVPRCNEGVTLRSCNGWEGLDFWEVPAYTPPGGGAQRSDPEDLPSMTVLQRFQADFERKLGTGIPVGINVHGPYLREESNRSQVIAFMQWAFAQPNTWGLTFQQYIAWKKAGSPTDVGSVLADYHCDDN